MIRSYALSFRRSRASRLSSRVSTRWPISDITSEINCDTVGSSSTTRIFWGRGATPTGGGKRGQLGAQLGPVPRLAFDAHLAAMLLNDSIDDRKSQARAHTHRLGREERIENARDDLRGNAGTVVRNF